MEVEGKLPVSKRKPAEVVATAKEDTNLSAAAEKVEATETPHRAVTAPELGIVLFADLKDAEQAEKAEKAVEEVEGVEERETMADADKDEIVVALTGEGKVQLKDLTSALQDAGIEARATKEKAKGKKSKK